VPVTVAGPYTVVAAPTGTVSYTFLDSSNARVASGTAPLTVGEITSTATVPLASSLAAGSYTVSLTYGGDSNYATSASATTVQVVVGRITPAISWTPASGAIIYGNTLNGILTASAANGGSSVPGVFTFIPRRSRVEALARLPAHLCWVSVLTRSP
jgi:hypothetical protein